MRDLLSLPLFSGIASRMRELTDTISQTPLVHLHAPATLTGVLAMAQLEAACLDAGLAYSRRFFAPKAHRPRDEPPSVPIAKQGCTVGLMTEEPTWSLSDLEALPWLRMTPLSTSMVTGSSNKTHQGSLDVVAQAAAIAALLAPNGRRVRSVRPMASLGMWMGSALDTSMDVFHNVLMHQLHDEGSLRLVPLPEVKQPKAGLIPNVSQRRVAKLSKAWPTMAVEGRRQALSELVLPALTVRTLSTPRLESLVWFRMVVGEDPVDLVSQIHHHMEAWPTEAVDVKSHCSKVLDDWLGTGSLWLGSTTD
jgi:hypothetical protein